MAEQAQVSTSAPDPTARILPALSATSDAPKTEGAKIPDPEPPKTEAVAEAPKPDAEAVEGEGETHEAEGGEKAPKKELEPWAKAEITKARNQKREAEATRAAAETRATTAEANLKKALEAVEKLTGESALSARKAITAEDPRPKRDAFDNPDAYDSALVEWAGRTAAVAATAAVEAKAEEARTAETAEAMRTKTAAENKALFESFSKRKDAFAKDHPDYEDIAESDDIKVSPVMAQVIWHDDDGPAIAYYLGQNPDEAERIASLSPARVGAELGRIAARLNAKPAVSTKPKPIKPLRNGENPASAHKSPDEESMAEYAARRNAEMRGPLNGAGTSH